MLRYAYDLWFEWRFHFALFQRFPVDFSVKEGVHPNCLLSSLVRHAAQALGWILRHELQTNGIRCSKVR